jgi:ATP-binding cassette subfamily B protein
VLSALPAILIILLIFRRHMRKWYLETRARIARMNAFLQENVSGMMTVQSFNREPRNFEMFENLNDRYRGAQVQTILGFALFYPAVAMVSNITLASVIWIGGRDLIQGRLMGAETLSFATLFLFVQCVSMLFGPMRQLSERYNLLQSAMASSARIFSLLDTRAQIVPPEDEVRPTGLNQGIEVQNVGFSYVAGEPVLRDVSFQIARGQTVAVVGHTGAGKTTLINLLTRFYDVAEGRILLDGVDLRRFDPRKLRRLYALVQQEVFLFSGTIASNLRMANPDLTDEEIWNLLREVRAEDFVRALPQGINSRIGERGSSLSTGQKQLLAFARALAVDPQFLILDEATANVDTATEQLIQEAIGRLLEGRTALVIAHRISTIQRADLILVMHKGRLHESGTHEELIARDGLYRKLYELQYRPETLAARAG